MSIIDTIRKIDESNPTNYLVRMSDTFEQSQPVRRNPHYEYNTPWGLYFYPYTYFKNVSVENGEYMGKESKLPFASESDYVNFYELVDTDGIMGENALGGVDKNTLDKTLKKLSEYYEREYPESVSFFDRLDTTVPFVKVIINEYKQNRAIEWEVDDSNYAAVIYTFPYLMDALGYTTTAKQKMFVFLKAGVKGFYDNGSGFITYNEPYQVIIFDNKLLGDVVTFENKKKFEDLISKLENSTLPLKAFDKIAEIYTEMANVGKGRELKQPLEDYSNNNAVKAALNGDIDLLIKMVDLGSWWLFDYLKKTIAPSHPTMNQINKGVPYQMKANDIEDWLSLFTNYSKNSVNPKEDFDMLFGSNPELYSVFRDYLGGINKEQAKVLKGIEQYMVDFLSGSDALGLFEDAIEKASNVNPIDTVVDAKTALEYVKEYGADNIKVLSKLITSISDAGYRNYIGTNISPSKILPPYRS